MIRSTFVFFLFTLSLSILLTCSCSPSRKERDTTYERMIAEHVHAAPEHLDSLLTRAIQHKKIIPEIIYRILLAQKIASDQDAANLQSEQYFVSANEAVKGISDPDLQVWIYTQTGFYYYSYYDYTRATPYFLQASKLIDLAIAKHPVDVVDVYKKNGFFFGSIGETTKGISYLETALKHANEKNKDYRILLYSLGNNYAEMGDLAKSESIFKQVLTLSYKRSDHEYYSKALGGLAMVAGKRGHTEEAERLWREDIHYSELSGTERNTMYARLQLGQIYLTQGQEQKALTTLLEAQRYVNERSYLASFDYEISELLQSYYATTGNDLAELQVRRRLDSISLARKQKDDEMAIRGVLLESQKEKLMWQIETEQTKAEKAWVYQIALSVVVALLGILLVLLIMLNRRNQRIQKNKYTNDILAFRLEKSESETKLREAHSSLSAYKQFLAEKNQQITQLENTLARLESTTSTHFENHKKGIDELLQSHLLTEEHWLAFKQAFIAEDTTFYDTIIRDYPNLTESQLRMIFLYKIGMNNTQMSKLLGITVEGVKKSKQRIRKKYGLLTDITDI